MPQPQAAQSGGAAQDVENYFADWFNRVDATSAAQPSWAAPLNTVTPLLKEFVQYSQTYKTLPNGAAVTTYWIDSNFSPSTPLSAHIRSPAPAKRQPSSLATKPR